MTTVQDGWRDDATGLMSGGYPPALAANDAEAGIAPPDNVTEWERALLDQQPEQPAPEPGERSVPAAELRPGDIARPHQQHAYQEIAAVEPLADPTGHRTPRVVILWRGGNTTTPGASETYLVASEPSATSWREQAARSAAAARTAADLRHYAAHWQRGELPPPQHHARLSVLVATVAEVETAAAALGVQVHRGERFVRCGTEVDLDHRGAVALDISALAPEPGPEEARP